MDSRDKLTFISLDTLDRNLRSLVMRGLKRSVEER